MSDHANLQPVFIAANVAECDFVERLLETEGIEYEVTPEAILQETHGSCRMGLLFEVQAGQAEYCRRLFADRGLARGVVEEA